MDYIDHYKIIDKIDEGGMGEIYLGFEEELQREVAIKLIKPELSSKEDIVGRFRTEAITLAKMHHTNIASVYKFGRLEDKFYIVMEYVKGQTLAEVLYHSGALPWQQAVSYTLGILDGLAHAHSFNIIHRDIKPSNLMISEHGIIKILDFGIAKRLSTVQDAPPKTRYAIGTLEYMSPEQIRVEDLDARSDIYTVGAVLYEMLTGHAPFEKPTEHEIREAHFKEKPSSPRVFSTEIPEQLAQSVLKALEKKPENRFANTQEFNNALRQVLAVESPKRDWFKSLKQLCCNYPGIVFMSSVFLVMAGVAANNHKPGLAEPQSTVQKLVFPASSGDIGIVPLPATQPQPETPLDIGGGQAPAQQPPVVDGSPKAEYSPLESVDSAGLPKITDQLPELPGDSQKHPNQVKDPKKDEANTETSTTPKRLETPNSEATIPETGQIASEHGQAKTIKEIPAPSVVVDGEPPTKSIKNEPKKREGAIIIKHTPRGAGGSPERIRGRPSRGSSGNYTQGRVKRGSNKDPHREHHTTSKIDSFGKDVFGY